MTNYQPITLPLLDAIQQDILNTIPTTVPEERRYLYFDALNTDTLLKIPSLYISLQQLNLIDYIDRMAMSHSLKSQSLIHIDPIGAIYSLNIPIANYHNTYLCFYSTNIKPSYNIVTTSKTKEEIRRLTYTEFKDTDCTLIEKYETTEPALINTKTPHKFYNLWNKHRTILLIRLKENFDPTSLVRLHGCDRNARIT
jgi:hypothetical protein